MSTLEICAIIAIPAGFVGLIAQSFLSAHIKEVGIKTAWKNILYYALFAVWIGCFVIGVFLQIQYFMSPNFKFLKVIDVISICMTISAVFFSVICAFMLHSINKFLDGRQQLYQIIDTLIDRIKKLENKSHD